MQLSMNQSRRVLFVPVAALLLFGAPAAASRLGGRVEGRRLQPPAATKPVSALESRAAATNATTVVQQAAAAAANAVAAVVGQTAVASAKSTAAVQQAVAAAANATAATAAAVALRAAEVPGTPMMEREMPLKAPEQGFRGKHVQHKDQETQTSDWQREFGHEEVKEPTTPAPKSAGAHAVVALPAVLLCLASAL
mmetsp:Transcript_56609/g.165542  ORF Transcript_56609/g.165542 Transcript_56609/m.165542 type:complete len:195 (-) Transcript_56609:92-676(-)